MSTFAVVFLCIQACLVQNVFSQYCGAYGPGIAPAALYPAAPCGYGGGLAELSYPGIGYAGAYPASSYGTGLTELAYPGIGYAGACPGLAPYGGAGEGNVAVAGELPAAGNSAVTGQVPIMGAVNFVGPVPAAGAVSISGNCACDCGSPYFY